MSDPAASSGGGGGLLQAWGWAILLIVLVMVNIIGMVSGQLNSLFQMMKFNAGPLLAILAVYFFTRAKK